MRLTASDAVGFLMLAGTVGAIAVHASGWGHGGGHQDRFADEGSSGVKAADPTSVAFVNVAVVLEDRGDVLKNQVVVVEGEFVRQIGHVGLIEPPAGARIVHGGGSRLLSPGVVDGSPEDPSSDRDSIDRSRILRMLQALGRDGTPPLAGAEALGATGAHAAATSDVGEPVRDRLDPAAGVGSFGVGSLANLVLVGGDSSDHRAWLQPPEGVMVRGRWYDTDALERVLGRKH